MPRQARPWFRFYVEAVHDRKLRRLRPEYRWLFVACLAAARQSCEPGWLLVGEDDPMGWEDLSDFAGMPQRQVEQGTHALQKAGVIAYDAERQAWFVPNWSARQFESDDVTARTTKHRRERSNDVPTNVPTTPEGTPPESETDTDTESSSSSSSTVPETVWVEVAKKKAADPNITVNDFSRWSPVVIAKDKALHGADAEWIWTTYQISVSQLAGIIVTGSKAILNTLPKREDPAA